MHSEITGDSFSFQLRNIALLSFEQVSEYVDIISPFTRIYLITEGSGFLILGNQKIMLEAGYLYLIPSFISCTYHFGKGLIHYYLHLSIEHPNGLSPFSLYPVTNKIKAENLDYSLFERLRQIDPNLQLPHHHPNVYQTKLWLNKKVIYDSANQHFETIGILKQLFSRFLQKQESSGLQRFINLDIQPILIYIQNNLYKDISVSELANLACYSKDHFSKLFRQNTGMSPCDYMIQKRIERSQFLLLTTNMPQKEIIEQTGFKSASYFSRVFKNQTGFSPAKYRNQRG